MRLNKYYLGLLIFIEFFSILALPVYSADIKVIEVKVEGNERIATSRILRSIKTQAEKEFSPALLREDVAALYALGEFSAIQVMKEEKESGLIIVFQVEEAPLITLIEFHGNNVFKDRVLHNFVSSRGGEVYNPVLVRKDREQIETHYREKGFSAVKVAVKEEKEPGGIKVRFIIEEGKRVKVSHIRIEGNSYFSSRQIKKQMQTRERRFFRAPVFDKDVLEDDLKKIVEFYHASGFLEMEITGKELSYDEAKENLVITIKVEEGIQYKLAGLSFSGNVAFPSTMLREKIKMVESTPYSPVRLQADVDRIRDFYYERGYIFIRVVPDEKVDEEKKIASVAYRIEEGTPAHVEQINISGNTRTREKVIRRELRIIPGDIFDLHKIRRSRQRLVNLGGTTPFFDEVDFSIEPGSMPDHRNLNFKVKEGQIGTVLFGGGYSSIEGFIGFLELDINNFDLRRFPPVGGGQRLQARASTGSSGALRNSNELTFTEPWLFDRPLSMGINGHDWTRDYDDYDEGRSGSWIQFGHPVGEYTKGYLTYEYEDVEIANLGEGISEEIAKEAGKFATSSLKLSLIHDTRDNFYDPTTGFRSKVSAELAGGLLKGERDYTRYVGQTSWYFPVWEKLVLNLRLRAGLVEEFGDSDRVPIFERFFLGGADTVRGYEYREVGPKDVNGDSVGGKTMFMGNVEFIFPLISDKIKGAVFIDGGNVWRTTTDMDLFDLKAGAGIGIRLSLPGFPINIDYAVALNPDPGDEERRFTFLIRGFSF